MSNSENGLDPRRWMQNLQPPAPQNSVKSATADPASSRKRTMMARVSGFFRRESTTKVPAPATTAPPPKPKKRIPVVGEISQETFEVPRCRSVLIAGDSIENPPMEITIALQRVGTDFGLTFFWKDVDAPDGSRRKTEFAEEEAYVRELYNMVVKEEFAPRKIAEEICRAIKQGKPEADGVLKALVDMETKPDWQAVYEKLGKR